jgi:hypothetical protein
MTRTDASSQMWYMTGKWSQTISSRRSRSLSTLGLGFSRTTKTTAHQTGHTLVSLPVVLRRRHLVLCVPLRPSIKEISYRTGRLQPDKSEESKDGNAGNGIQPCTSLFEPVLGLCNEAVPSVRTLDSISEYYMLDSCVIQSSLPPYKIAVVQVQ